MLTLNKENKVYVSGPIRNYENGNRKAFDDASAILEKHGYTPVNPHVLNDLMSPERKSIYSECLRDDYKELVTCDAIFMLKGWQHSTGANAELRMALDMELLVFFETRFSEQVRETQSLEEFTFGALPE